jgi:hypothetical protein
MRRDRDDVVAVRGCARSPSPGGHRAADEKDHSESPDDDTQDEHSDTAIGHDAAPFKLTCRSWFLW